MQAGRFSSHFILRCLHRFVMLARVQCQQVVSRQGRMRKKGIYVARENGGWEETHLQLLQPVLTLGLLVLARLCFGGSLEVEYVVLEVKEAALEVEDVVLEAEDVAVRAGDGGPLRGLVPGAMMKRRTEG